MCKQRRNYTRHTTPSGTSNEHLTAFGKCLNDDQQALIWSDITIADDNKLQLHLKEIYESNKFDNQEMLFPYKQWKYIIGVNNKELKEGIANGKIPFTIANSTATSGVGTISDPCWQTGLPSNKQFILPDSTVYPPLKLLITHSKYGNDQKSYTSCPESVKIHFSAQ